jgi:malonyl-CoA O-methyltransferase
MTIQEAYNDWSEQYDSDDNATRDLDQTVLMRCLHGRRFESIVEIGCGTGKNTLFLAGIGRTLHALDFSEGMIARAREKCRELPHVTFSIADITRPWPCADHCADLATCNLVLEHVEKLDRVFAEASRVLVKGGTFLLSELHPFRQYAGGAANFSNDGKATRIQAHTHHISEFLDAGRNAGFALKRFQEWWHEKDTGKPPRLMSCVFESIGND